MADTKKNFDLNNINDNVELLSTLLDKSNRSGNFSLEESAWVFTCLTNMRSFVKSAQELQQQSLQHQKQVGTMQEQLQQQQVNIEQLQRKLDVSLNIPSI